MIFGTLKLIYYNESVNFEVYWHFPQKYDWPKRSTRKCPEWIWLDLFMHQSLVTYFPFDILSDSFVSECGSQCRGSPGVALGLGIKAGGPALSSELPHVSPSTEHRWPALWPSPEQARGSFPDTSGTWHLTSLLEDISYQAFTWKN